MIGDEELDEGVCVGTFRWKQGKKFPTVSSLCVNGHDSGLRGELDGGWPKFLATRCGSEEAVAKSRQDLAVVDGLSFPVTMLYVLDRLGFGPTQVREKGVKRFDIVLLGATYKAEVRIFKETEYFEQVRQHYGDDVLINFWFVGPELCRPGEDEKESQFLHRSTGAAFLRDKHPELARPTKERRTILFGFNPGFGSGAKGLLESWLPDLLYLTKSTSLPIIFTQANDYSDLRGEMLVMSQIGANYVLIPSRNPFHMAMTACLDPSNAKDSTWSCGNSFLYSIQGRRSTEDELNPSKVVVLNSLLAKFGKTAKGFSLSDCQLKVEECKPFQDDVVIEDIWGLDE